MTTKELSEFFNVSTKTIQNKARELGLEIKQGQTKKWTKEEVSLLANSFESSKFEVAKPNKIAEKDEK